MVLISSPRTVSARSLSIWQVPAFLGPAATVFEAQFTHVGIGVAIKDRLADGEDGVLPLEFLHDVDGDIALGGQRVDEETIGGIDGFLVAQIQYHQVVMHGGAALDLCLGQWAVFVVQLHSFAHVR